MQAKVIFCQMCLRLSYFTCPSKPITVDTGSFGEKKSKKKKRSRGTEVFYNEWDNAWDKKKRWERVSDRLFCCYPLLLNLCIQEQQVPRGGTVFVEEREQMYRCSQMYKCSERGGLKKVKSPVERNSPTPFFLYLIPTYNGRKNMKQIWCSRKKRKGKLYLLAWLLFRTVNILLLWKKIATRKNKKQEKYRILTEISILSKTPRWLLIHLAFLLSLSQHSDWQHHPVVFLSNSLTYWPFVNRTNSCWLLCPKYQASSYILSSSHLQPQMGTQEEEQSCSIDHTNSAATGRDDEVPLFLSQQS